MSTDRIYVLTASGLEDVPQTSVAGARLAAYGTGQDGLAGWTVAGTLATVSHGVALIFSAPAWIIGGIASASAESRAALLTYPKRPLVSFSPYARFPQGLPDDLEPAALGSLRAVGSKPVRQ